MTEYIALLWHYISIRGFAMHRSFVVAEPFAFIRSVSQSFRESTLVHRQPVEAICLFANYLLYYYCKPSLEHVRFIRVTVRVVGNGGKEERTERRRGCQSRMDSCARATKEIICINLENKCPRHQSLGDWWKRLRQWLQFASATLLPVLYNNATAGQSGTLSQNRKNGQRRRSRGDYWYLHYATVISLGAFVGNETWPRRSVL